MTDLTDSHKDVFCVDDEKMLSITESDRFVPSFEKCKQIDHFVLSATVFQDFSSTSLMTHCTISRRREKFIDEKKLLTTFCLSVNSLSTLFQSLQKVEGGKDSVWKMKKRETLNQGTV